MHPQFIAEPQINPEVTCLPFHGKSMRTREGFLVIGAVFTRPPSCRLSLDVRARTLGSFCVICLTPIFIDQPLCSNGALCGLEWGAPFRASAEWDLVDVTQVVSAERQWLFRKPIVLPVMVAVSGLLVEVTGPVKANFLLPPCGTRNHT